MSISRRSLNECYKFSCETASFFVKINRSFSAREMFEGEAGSLQAMRFAGMNAPAPLKVGDLPHGGSYLIMDHVAFEPDLMLEPSSQAKLGEAIAQMHLHQPERHQFFGFGLPTRLGTVEMENKFCASWAEFFVESRLRRALESVGNKKCHSSILVDRAEEICEKASGMLLEIDESIRPSVLHGDLWYFSSSSLLLSPILSFPLHSTSHLHIVISFCWLNPLRRQGSSYNIWRCMPCWALPLTLFTTIHSGIPRIASLRIANHESHRSFPVNLDIYHETRPRPRYCRQRPGKSVKSRAGCASKVSTI